MGPAVLANRAQLEDRSHRGGPQLEGIAARGEGWVPRQIRMILILEAYALFSNMLKASRRRKIYAAPDSNGCFPLHHGWPAPKQGFHQYLTA